MRINVLKRHIEGGNRRGLCSCPIALALIEQVSCKRVEVLNFARIDGKSFDLPAKAKTFIQKFDAGYPVEPFSFSIR